VVFRGICSQTKIRLAKTSVTVRGSLTLEEKSESVLEAVKEKY
jgi:hypothetical protein